MIHVAFFLMLQAQAQQQPPAPPKPMYYQWRDRAGKIHHTTSPPPSYATVIAVTTPKDPESDAEPDGTQPTPQEFRLKMESVMNRDTVSYWRGVEDALVEARQSNDVEGQLGALDAVMRHALWGNGLWALAGLPLVVMVFSILFAWWACAGLAKRTKVLVWAACALAGLALSAIGLNSALYAPQARRLDFALSMLPNYLGEGAEAKPENLQLIRSQSEALREAAVFQDPIWTPVWAFPLEVRSARQALEQLVLDP